MTHIWAFHPGEQLCAVSETPTGSLRLSWNMPLEPWAGVGGGEGKAAYKHSQDPALLMCSPVDIDGRPLWRQSFGPDGPQLWWSTVVLWVLCFNRFFQGKWLRCFYSQVKGEKTIQGEMKMYCPHHTAHNHLVLKHLLLQTEGLISKPRSLI